MPKNWPSDNMIRQKGRKHTKPAPELPGWNYFDPTTNLFIHCQKCNKLEREMFYRYIRPEGSAVGITEAVCVSCSKDIAGERKQG